MPFRRLAWAFGGCVWLALVIAGLAVLMSYDNRPGGAAHAPLQWPHRSRLQRDPSKQTLIMLAHPKCDCTRASLVELAELLGQANGRPKTFVVFIKPKGVPGDWQRTSLWATAERVPGVTVITDENGREAARFGIETSGQTLLYDQAGTLRFSGGITGARGKTGNNVGRQSLVSWLNRGAARQDSTPVFGCSLFGPADERETSEMHQHES
jgi:hypothetical protein